MNTNFPIALLLFLLFTFHCVVSQAQEVNQSLLTEQEQQSYLELQNRIEAYEKQVLKTKVEEINELLASGEITEDEANRRKVAAAELAAQNIQELGELVDVYTTYMKRNFKEKELNFSQMDFSEMDTNIPMDELADFFMELNDFFESLNFKKQDQLSDVTKKREEVEQRRQELKKAREELDALRQSNQNVLAETTKSETKNRTDQDYNFRNNRSYGFLVMGISFNNAMTEEGGINDTPYRFGGSRSFEIGYARRTPVFRNSNWLNLVYGFSFQFNGLKPEGNRIFVNNDGVTELQEFEFNLSKNKFRMDNIIVPLHLELASSRRVTNVNNVRYINGNEFKLGVGGFVGLNMTTLQKLEYRNENDRRVKDKLKSGYNTNTIIYGLSAYLGWNDFAFFAQYNLNPIFKNNPVDEYNFQIGVRYEIF